MRALHQPQIICSLLVLAILTNARRTDSQTTDDGQQGAQPYGLHVSVDEVVVTFHAADAHGLPINDLTLNELTLSDNGRPPRKVLAFQSLQNLPIRAGILMDTSESMQSNLAVNRTISARYAQWLLRQQTDQAFVMKFGPLSQIKQPWTSDTNALTAGIRRFATYGPTRIRGTVLFDAIYQACLNQFGHIDHANSGNFLLIFSDGEDNASHASLKEAVDICQHTNTAIYAFRTDPQSSFGAEGPKILADLAAESGGRVFNVEDSDAGVDNDLRTIEADLRNQYRLIYKPAELKHDGSFHQIVLKASERVDNITIRSGYYAPTH